MERNVSPERMAAEKKKMLEKVVVLHTLNSSFPAAIKFTANSY